MSKNLPLLQDFFKENKDYFNTKYQKVSRYFDYGVNYYVKHISEVPRMLEVLL